MLALAGCYSTTEVNIHHCEPGDTLRIESLDSLIVCPEPPA